WLRRASATSARTELEASLRRLVQHQLRGLRGRFGSPAEDLPSDSPDDLPAWVALADLLLTQSGGWRRRADKGAKQVALLARFSSDDALCEALSDVRRLPTPEFSDSQWQAMQDAVCVLKLAVAELQLVFREHSSVDFAELAIRASQALGALDSPTDLALAL